MGRKHRSRGGLHDRHTMEGGSLERIAAMHWWICVVTSSLDADLIARFMGPTWGPSGAGRTQVEPVLAPLTLLYGRSNVQHSHCILCRKSHKLYIDLSSCIHILILFGVSKNNKGNFIPHIYDARHLIVIYKSYRGMAKITNVAINCTLSIYRGSI